MAHARYPRTNREAQHNLWRATYVRSYKPKREGRQWKGPCPHCGGDDRFWYHIGRPLFGCRQCRPARDREAFRAIVAALDNGHAWLPPPVSCVTPATDAEEIHKAQRYWTCGVSVAGTPAERYLRMRGLYWPERPGYEATRWISRWTGGAEGLFHEKPDAVVGTLAFPLTTVDGEVRAVTLEYLQGDGTRPEPRLRRTRGRKTNTLFRVPGPPGDVHIAEGECTALACHVLYGAAAASTGSLDGLRHLRASTLPPDMQTAIIHADFDTDGRGLAAARTCGRALKQARLQVLAGEWADGVDAADVTGHLTWQKHMATGLKNGMPVPEAARRALDAWRAATL